MGPATDTRTFARAMRGAAIAVGAAFLLAGCGQEETGDLKAFVAKVESRKGGRIEPLPEFKSYETYSYQGEGRSDPFQPVEREQVAAQEEPGGSEIRPDLGRRKEPLEAFPLDSLGFVGHMQKNDEAWAVVTAPDGVVHRVQQGDHLGQNHGRIHTITESKVLLTEIVPDGTGGWVEREAALALED